MSKFRHKRERQYRTPKPRTVPNGTPLGIHDCNGAELCMGDFVMLLATPYRGERGGRINELEKRTVRVGLWRYESHPIPLDDGKRMHVRKMTEAEAEKYREWYRRTWAESERMQEPHNLWKRHIKHWRK